MKVEDINWICRVIMASNIGTPNDRHAICCHLADLFLERNLNALDSEGRLQTYEEGEHPRTPTPVGTRRKLGTQ